MIAIPLMLQASIYAGDGASAALPTVPPEAIPSAAQQQSPALELSAATLTAVKVQEAAKSDSSESPSSSVLKLSSQAATPDSVKVSIPSQSKTTASAAALEATSSAAASAPVNAPLQAGRSAAVLGELLAATSQAASSPRLPAGLQYHLRDLQPPRHAGFARSSSSPLHALLATPAEVWLGPSIGVLPHLGYSKPCCPWIA